MSSKTSVILTILHVMLWIVFIGLCIQTGVSMFSYVLTNYAHYMKLPADHWAMKHLNSGHELAEVYHYGFYHFSILGAFLIILLSLKASIAHYFIKISLELKLDKPFTLSTYKHLGSISLIAFWGGILAVLASAYSQWLGKKGVAIQTDWSYQEFLFFSAVMYVLAQVFKKGAELQSESELTI